MNTLRYSRVDPPPICCLTLLISRRWYGSMEIRGCTSLRQGCDSQLSGMASTCFATGVTVTASSKRRSSFLSSTSRIWNGLLHLWPTSLMASLILPHQHWLEAAYWAVYTCLRLVCVLSPSSTFWSCHTLKT